MRFFLLSYFILSAISVLNGTDLFYGWKEPSENEMEKIRNYPAFSPLTYDTELPYSVNNSYQIYFRPVFSQYANDCSHASGVGYTFTYEMNYMRNTNANFYQNQFPHYFSYNYLNKGNELNGSSYLSAWDVLTTVGCPYIYDYGGMVPSEDPEERDILWMSGYDKYERAMENRVSGIIRFPLDTEEGLYQLKRWLYDRGDGSSAGGVANFSAGVNYTWETGILPEGTENEGELVITKWHTTVNHAMTIAGYNDSIRFDLNGDNRFTNDIDITGDEIVDMRDREIGALLMVNSWGTGWGNYGRAWVLYSTLGYEHWEGGIWTRTAYSITTFENYQPLLTMRTELDYPKRDNLKIYAGISSDTLALVPDICLDLPYLEFAGGNNPMSGDSSYIELGIDLTPLLHNAENFTEAKIFLCVAENDTLSDCEGSILSMETIDEWGNVCAAEGCAILDNDTTCISVKIPVFYNTPLITVTSLPEIIPGEPYSVQMTCRGGRDPFRWDFVYGYSEETSTDPFPEGDFIRMDFPHNNFDNDLIPFKPEFQVPFYGKYYDSLYICTDGYICFKNKFTYIDDESSVTNNRMIAPCAAELEYSYDLGDGIYYMAEEGSVTFKWSASEKMRPETDLIFAAKIFPDGRIKFYHSDNNSEDVIWYSGISEGDSVNFSVSETPLDYTPAEFPYGLTMNDGGLITGSVAEYGQSWDLKVRVTDWNGISSEKTFALNSATGIEDSTVPGKIRISNYPNPFNSATSIYLELERDLSGSLLIYNPAGQVVGSIFKNRRLQKGSHSVIWEPGNLSSGIYYLTLRNNSGVLMSVKTLFLK